MNKCCYKLACTFSRASLASILYLWRRVEVAKKKIGSSLSLTWQMSHSSDIALYCSFVLYQQHIISPQTQLLIHRITEPGHLFIMVSSFVQAMEGQPAVGTIKQSLCHHIKTQITEYCRLVTILESQMVVTAQSTLLDGTSDALEPGIPEQETRPTF